MPTSRVILTLYAFAATVNVMASVRGPASLDWATTPLLLPLIVGAVLVAAHESGRRPSRAMLVGLITLGVANIAGELTGGIPAWATAGFVAFQLFAVYAWISRRAPQRVGAA